MTCLEKFKEEHPQYNANGTSFPKGVKLEPTIAIDKDGTPRITEVSLVRDEEPHILDSGNRREFETGAVRDIQEGKGRCDLLPLDVVAHFVGRFVETDCVLKCIYNFQYTRALKWLYDALDMFSEHFDDGKTKASEREIDIQRRCTMALETSIHFEEGAKKYGENNWQKGIPVHCYIDSAVRHYLKFLRGDKDEPHDRAFCWNIMCAIWTCKHKPELNDYGKEENHVLSQ